MADLDSQPSKAVDASITASGGGLLMRDLYLKPV